MSLRGKTSPCLPKQQVLRKVASSLRGQTAQLLDLPHAGSYLALHLSWYGADLILGSNLKANLCFPTNLLSKISSTLQTVMKVVALQKQETCSRVALCGGANYDPIGEERGKTYQQLNNYPATSI